MYKAITLFIKLCDICGLTDRDLCFRLQNELESKEKLGTIDFQKIINKMQLHQETATLLWRLVKVSPVLSSEKKKAATSIRKLVNFTDLEKDLRQELLFAEELIRRKLVPLGEINRSLELLQKNKNNLSLGQMFLRKHLITPEQFIQLKQQIKISVDSRVNSRLTLNQRTGAVQLMSVDVPESIGRYEIIREIARGGMGIVYEARDKELDRIVALKTLISGEMADEQELERFQREAKLTASFDHPNIVPIHEVGIYEKTHYFTMDYIDGISLSEYVRTVRCSLKKIIKMMVQITGAIAYAHGMNVIHRDIKPANILVDTNSGKPLVTDFGLARQQNAKGLTMSGIALGTPAYMPPEQAEGKIRAISNRSDIYSLGAVLYELLAGRPPFTGTSLAETLQAVIHEEPVPLCELVPGLPVDIETLCMKCLEKKASKRYHNAKMLLRDMERFLKGNPIRARRSSPFQKIIKKIKQNRIVYSAVAIIIFIMLIFLSWKISDIEKLRKAKHIIEKKIAETVQAKKRAEETAKKASLAMAEAKAKAKEAGLQKKKALKNLGQAFLYKGVLLMEYKRYDAAILSFNKATQYDPELDIAFYQKAIIHIVKKQFSEALASLTKAIALNKKSAEAYSKRAYTYYKMKRYELALSDCQHTLELNPRDADSYNMMALIVKKQRNYRQAFRYIDRAIQLAPKNVVYRINRAEFYWQTKNYKKALRDYQKSLKLNPEDQVKRIKRRIKIIQKKLRS